MNQLPKSVVREIRTPRSVGTGGGRPPPVTRWAGRNPRPYRDHGAVVMMVIVPMNRTVEIVAFRRIPSLFPTGMEGVIPGLIYYYTEDCAIVRKLVARFNSFERTMNL